MSGLDEAESFEAGHLTEAAVALLADGEPGLVPAEARDHAAGCESCSARVAEAALASAEVHAAFSALGEQREERRAEVRALSRAGAGWAIALGLAVAAVAAGPSAAGLLGRLLEARKAVGVVVSVGIQVEQALRASAEQLAWVRVTTTWAASLALIAVGVWIARSRTRATNVEEAGR